MSDEFCKYIQERRRERGLSGDDMARRVGAGFSRQRWHQIECVSVANRRTLREISNVLRLDYSVLVELMLRRVVDIKRAYYYRIKRGEGNVDRGG